MAGTCLLAYGVVFVLLIGEIDLSVSFVSGVAGVIVAETQLPTGVNLPWYLCVFLAILAAALIGAFQGSIVALVGVPSFVVTLAGYEIWQGVILRSIPGGVIVIQDNAINNFSNYLFPTGWWGRRGCRAAGRSPSPSSSSTSPRTSEPSMTTCGTASRSATRSCSR